MTDQRFEDRRYGTSDDARLLLSMD